MGSADRTMWTAGAFSSLLLVVLLHQVYCEDGAESKATARVFDMGDITAAITNLTSNYFLVKALIIYWLHLLFQTAGWVLGSLLWNSLRPGVNDPDPDFGLAVSSGLLDTEFSGTNLSLALGQWAFYFAFWTGMLVVFGLTSKSRSLSARRSEDGIERADLDLSQPVLERAMDDLFNPHTIAKQTILNILGTVGGSVFVAAMSHLPDSDILQAAAGRRSKENIFLARSETDGEYNYSYHTGY